MSHLRKAVLVTAGFNLLAGVLAMGAGADRWQSLVDAGTRTVLVTREGGIDYRNIMEVFSIGNEHFRVVARAPTEVFDRYASVFDAMIESVQILPVAGQPPADNVLPPVTNAPK